MFLVTGCGRSGTGYTAKACRAVGLDVGHEYLGEDGAVSSLWCVDSAWYPKYHQQGSRPKFDVILHQVRHPLKVIGSVTTAREDSWQFICDHTKIKEDEPLLVRAAKYWYYWNIIAEAQAVFTYRIENLENAWPAIMCYINRRDLVGTYEQFEWISKTVNSREHRDITWGDIETSLVKKLAGEYGYKVGG